MSAGWLTRADTSRPAAIVRRPLSSDTLQLADGRQVVVRPVTPGDTEAEGEFISRLSPATRRLRFHGAVNQLPQSALHAMTRVDHERHVALIATARRGRPRIVADARYVVDAPDDAPPLGDAEFAIAVADRWQGLGLGRALMQRLARHAREHGVNHLHGLVLADNEPMLTLMQGLGAQLLPDPDDAAVVRVRVAT